MSDLSPNRLGKSPLGWTTGDTMTILDERRFGHGLPVGAVVTLRRYDPSDDSWSVDHDEEGVLWVGSEDLAPPVEFSGISDVERFLEA